MSCLRGGQLRDRGEQGALFLAALEAFLEPAQHAEEHPDAAQDSVACVAPQAGSAEQPGPEPTWEAEQAELVATVSERAPGAAVDRVAARRADALVALAEAARERGTADRSGSVGEQFDVVVHVHADTATAEIEGGPALPISTAQRLACQARVSALITDRRGNPLYLGRRRRLVSRHLLWALRMRDHGKCQFPGCTNQRVDAHHIVPWLAGGRTDISNLVLVCRFHHGLIHDHGYQIHWVNGDLEFRRPNGAPIPEAAPPTTGTLEHLVESHAAQQLEITDDSLTPPGAAKLSIPTRSCCACSPNQLRQPPELNAGTTVMVTTEHSISATHLERQRMTASR